MAVCQFARLICTRLTHASALELQKLGLHAWLGSAFPVLQLVSKQNVGQRLGWLAQRKQAQAGSARGSSAIWIAGARVGRCS